VYNSKNLNDFFIPDFDNTLPDFDNTLPDFNNTLPRIDFSGRAEKCEIHYLNNNDNNQYISNEKHISEFNPQFTHGTTITIQNNCSNSINLVKSVLEDFVEKDVVDFCEVDDIESSFEGRIYSKDGDAEFKCQIYQLTNNDEKCVLELSRMGGDGFLFNEFREKLLNRLPKDNTVKNDDDYIDNQSSQMQSFMSDDSNTDMISEIQLSESLTVNDDSEMKKSKGCIDKNEAQSILKNATDFSCCREILRDNVAVLGRFVDDENNKKVFAEIENIFEKLLEPMIKTDGFPLLDCWIIKTLLEVVLKLRSLKQASSIDSSIQLIHDTWNKPVDHPFGIAKFIPSQQICRVCDQIMAIKVNKQKF